MENKFEVPANRKTIFSYFLLYALINALLLYYIHDIIITDPQYFTGGNMNSVNLYRRLWMVFYFISPFYEMAKLLIISALVFYAIKTVKKLQTQFWGIFYIVLLAQFLLLIPDLLELVWFTFIKTNYSMGDVKYFTILSLANLVNYENISHFLFSLLESVNLFNIFYWSLLVYLIKKHIEINLKDSIIVVFCFYGFVAIILKIVWFLFLFKIYA
jgi:hypothetical protein